MDDKNSLTGEAYLLLDGKVMVCLRDGRMMIGYLRNVDQFANLVLHETIEKIFTGNHCTDIVRGICTIRSDSVSLLAAIDRAEEKRLNDRDQRKLLQDIKKERTISGSPED